MRLFGWSLPPGCGTLPDEEDAPCECCGHDEWSCICPECPECGEVGNPICYKEHGLHYTALQLNGQNKALEYNDGWEDDLDLDD